MKVVKSHAKEFLVLTILLAIAVSVVNAAVFVYYPVGISANWAPPSVYFSGGTNANQTDLGAGNTISVILSDGYTTASGKCYTSASLTVHPSSYGTTYYKDVLRINNGGNQAYYIGFIVNTAFTNTTISTARLILKTTDGSTTVGTVDLKSTGTTWKRWLLNSNSQLVVDLEFTISSSSSGSDSASISLVYSPQSTESPPSP